MRGALSLLLITCSSAFAADKCVACHPKEVRGYQQTAMAKSLFRPGKQPSGSFTHALSGSTFTVRSANNEMRQRLERNGFEGEFPVAYVIGSGNHAFGYLVQVGDYLFQSPVSYYSRKKVWDVAPGYEGDRNPDFTRPVTVECLFCHSGRPLPVKGTLNRYEKQPFAEQAISCDRCHGPAEEHLKRPSAATIVNPKKLPVRARDSVCEQCHLGGEARIPNPGRQISDFQPGQELEDVLGVYVYQNPAAGGLKVVSHAEQLALSKCSLASAGKLWCGTCHNPHDQPAQPAAYFREKCLECHAAKLEPAHRAAGRDCIACHMAKQPVRDGGHTAFTNHRISRQPSAAESKTGAPLTLAAWRALSPAIATRNLGLANITVGERDHNAAHMDTGFRLLSADYEQWKTDPAVLTALGLVVLRKDKPADAAKFYQAALALAPNYAAYHINVATALSEAGNMDTAIQHLEQAIGMDPSLEAAYRKLADIYTKRKQRNKVRETLSRYLKFMPNNVSVQNALDEQ
jgi:tetratricopeptide (TPR) repeat protein